MLVLMFVSGLTIGVFPSTIATWFVLRILDVDFDILEGFWGDITPLACSSLLVGGGDCDGLRNRKGCCTPTMPSDPQVIPPWWNFSLCLGDPLGSASVRLSPPELSSTPRPPS